MARFRFRAKAALDLRAKQEQEALAAFSRADGEFRRVRAARAELDHARLRGMEAELEAQRQGTDGTRLAWYRNWIEGLAATAARLDQELEARAKVVAHAKQAWHEARRKRRALERMRDRAWQRFRREQDRQERIVLDELARLRFLMPEFGGANRDRDSEPDRPTDARPRESGQHVGHDQDRQRLPGID